MVREIVLPELPEYLRRDLSHMTHVGLVQTVHQAMRAAVEADRAAIVVTSEDVEAACDAYFDFGMRAALESFAARLRGTP